MIGSPYQKQFEDYVADKYGTTDGIHHYEIAQSSGPTSSFDNSHMIEVNSTCQVFRLFQTMNTS